MPRLRSQPNRLSVAPPRLSMPPKEVQPHYRTPEHQAWAREVKRRAGFRCQAEGCTAKGQRLIADHIIELRDGGAPLDPENGRALCLACHNTKTAAARLARR
jgi:5-methylcytosine-specific restriction protein A